MNSPRDDPKGPGFPIRTPTDQRLLAAPHGFSQRAASFIASVRQGIHQMLLLRLIQRNPSRAGTNPNAQNQTHYFKTRQEPKKTPNPQDEKPQKPEPPKALAILSRSTMPNNPRPLGGDTSFPSHPAMNSRCRMSDVGCQSKNAVPTSDIWHPTSDSRAGGGDRDRTDDL